MLFNSDGIHRTDLSANVAFYAFFLVNLMLFIRFKANGIRWTTLCTFGASDAGIVDLVMDEWQAFPRRTPTKDMGFIFLPEIAQGGENRIRGCLSQSAQTPPGGAVSKFFKAFQVFRSSFSVSDYFKQFKHPACADSAKSASAARLVLSE
jgi:hypothetical protein